MTKSPTLIVALFFLAILSVSSILALTASIDNPKMVLFKNITEGKKLVFDNSVVVLNDNNGSVNISVKADKDWEQYVVIKDGEFVLQEGENKEVFYTITLNKAGIYAGNIIVTFTDPESGSRLSLAQRLVVQVKGVEGRSNNKTIIYISLGTLVILIILLILLMAAKNKFFRARRRR